jgi:DNA-binding NarL/FixJ family response regulator
MADTVLAPATRVRNEASERGLALVDGAEYLPPRRQGTRSRAIRIAIADGQALVRAGLRALFESEEDIAVVAEAADGGQAVALVAKMRPDVVLIDIGLPGTDAVEVTREISADRKPGGPGVMIIAAQADDERLFAALRAGASGFLLKDTDATAFVEAVRVVASGDALLSPSITRRLIAEIAAQPDPNRPSPEQLEDLTAREREVVALVAAGLSNQEIAERLVVSPATAKTHVSRALYKVHARDRAQLVALAYETGLVTPRNNEALHGREPASTLAFVAV